MIKITSKYMQKLQITTKFLSYLNKNKTTRIEYHNGLKNDDIIKSDWLSMDKF